MAPLCGAQAALVCERASPDELAADQDHAVNGEEDRRVERLGEEHPQLVLEGEAHDPDGDRGHDEQPDEPLVGRLHAPRAQRGEERADEPQPVSPVVREEPDRGPDMEPDEEREVEAVALRLGAVDVVPPEERREDDAVPEARHPEELGDALHEPDDDRLEVRDVVRDVVHGECRHATWSGAAPSVSGRLPACAGWSWSDMRRRVATRRAAITVASCRRGAAPRRPRCADGPSLTSRSRGAGAPRSSRTRRAPSRPLSLLWPAARRARGRSSTLPCTTG